MSCYPVTEGAPGLSGEAPFVVSAHSPRVELGTRTPCDCAGTKRASTRIAVQGPMRSGMYAMSVVADDSSVAEALEAACRQCMTELAHMPSRGWDTQRERAKILAELDGLLDDWLAAR